MSACSFAQTGAEQQASRHFSLAHQAQDAGDLAGAAREYREALRLAPGTAEIDASLGMVLYAEGKFPEATHALDQANRLKPSLPGVTLYLGMSYAQEHQPLEALPLLRTSVSKDPASKDANLWLGRSLWAAGQQQQALVQLRHTSSLFPADPVLLLECGEAYHKAAEEGIARVLEAAEGKPLAHQVYGDIYTDEHAWANAAAHYYRALALDPRWPGAHFGLGEIAFAQQKLVAATEQYQQEVAINPRSGAALARLGELAILTGHPRGSLASDAAGDQRFRIRSRRGPRHSPVLPCHERRSGR